MKKVKCDVVFFMKWIIQTFLIIFWTIFSLLKDYKFFNLAVLDFSDTVSASLRRTVQFGPKASIVRLTDGMDECFFLQ